MNKEQMSALLDGELDELSTARLLKALEQDEALFEQWEMHGLIGDALREGAGMSTAGRAGARRAMAQIATEPAPRRERRLPRLPAGWMSWAIAASAALVAFQLTSTGLPAVDGAMSASAGSVRSAASAMLASAGFGEPAAREADPAEMDRFIDLHREVADPGVQHAAPDSVQPAGGARGQ